VRRNYNWESTNIDPKRHRFGKVINGENNNVAKSLFLETGSSVIGSKRVVDVRSQLSHPHRANNNNTPIIERAIQSPHEEEWGARRVIQGNYDIKDQLPDKDLGKSVRANKSGISQDEKRVYGVPTIRSDRAPPQLRSVADSNNYGDEQTARSLLQGRHSNMSQQDLFSPRTPTQLRMIFESVIGDRCSDDEFSALCRSAVELTSVLCVDSLRQVVNQQKKSKG